MNTTHPHHDADAWLDLSDFAEAVLWIDTPDIAGRVREEEAQTSGEQEPGEPKR